MSAANYYISLSFDRELTIHEGYSGGGTIAMPKEKLGVGYMEHLAVIEMTKEDFKALRDTLNKILANEGDNK